VFLLLAGALAVWLFVDAATADCGDAERRPYQLVSSALTLLGVLAAYAGLYRSWRGRSMSGLLPLALPVVIVAGWFAVILVGCGN
jgi:hypothetical protein